MNILDILEYGLHQPITLVLQKKMHVILNGQQITGPRA